MTYPSTKILLIKVWFIACGLSFSIVWKQESQDIVGSDVTIGARLGSLKTAKMRVTSVPAEHLRQLRTWTDHGTSLD